VDALIAALGFVATLLGVLIGGRISERGAVQRLRAEQQYAYQAAKFERLRELYSRIAGSVETIRWVIAEQHWLAPGEDVDTRDARHSVALNEAQTELSAVGRYLLVEPGTAEVRDTFSRLRLAFVRCRRAWLANDVVSDARVREIDESTTLAEGLCAREIRCPRSSRRSWQRWRSRRRFRTHRPGGRFGDK
jgi:hypothetical protein